MFYVIKISYCGPKDKNEVHQDRVEIRTTPAITNRSHEERADGWCGAIGNLALTETFWALGTYETIEEARRAIREMFGATRQCEAGDEQVVETHLPGVYKPLSAADTEAWIYDDAVAYITAATTDDQLAEYAAACRAEANREGLELDENLERFLEDLRQEKREKADD